MNSMMKLLAAAKLIELDDNDKLSQLQASESHTLESTDLSDVAGTDISHDTALDGMLDTASHNDEQIPSESETVSDAVNTGETETPLPVKSKAFEQIYADASIAESPYPAERLIRLLDGLQAMDAPTRHAAVQAMDAADDTWSIADPISDAERKSASLNAYVNALQTQNAAYEQQLNNDIQLLKSEQAETVASIRKQIEDLESLQQRQIEKTQAAIAEKQAAISQQHESVALEVARVDAEKNKLSQVAQQFAHLLSSS